MSEQYNHICVLSYSVDDQKQSKITVCPIFFKDSFMTVKFCL